MSSSFSDFLVDLIDVALRRGEKIKHPEIDDWFSISLAVVILLFVITMIMKLCGISVW